MLKRISPSVYCWSEIHGAARNQPYNWNSYLIHVREKNVLALVDPIPLSDDEVREVKELGMPTHILLTCNYHLRESERYRQKWGCKILVNQSGLKDAEVPIDDTFQDGSRLWNFIDVISIPDVYFSDETALLVREEGGVLIIGDAFSGSRKDQDIPDGELGIPFPEHSIDIQKARASLFRLLNYSFEVMCFGHGSPILSGAKEKLSRFLNNDEIWEQLMKSKHSMKH